MTSEERRNLLRRIHVARQKLHVTPDRQAREESEDLDAQRKKTELSGLKQDIDERKKYAGRIFWLVVCWLIGVGVVLLLQGFLGAWGIFKLPDAVLSITVGSTTASIVAIFIVVAKYLFPKR